LGARTSKKPGQFKDKNNRAGETHFVDHTLLFLFILIEKTVNTIFLDVF
jgi:hypothetical protein